MILLIILNLGTGKSITGAHLAYVFAKGNRLTKDEKSVLYCGPSNKSVDVVHGKKQMSTCMYQYS